MRKLKCEFCKRVVKELDESDEEYLKKFPLAAGAWFEELLDYHYYYECPANLPEDFQAGIGNGYIE